jgi:hypothetical protein
MHPPHNFDFTLFFLKKKMKLGKWFSTTNQISSSNIQICITESAGAITLANYLEPLKSPSE